MHSRRSSCCGVLVAGHSRSRLASGHFVEAPAAVLFPHRARREFPKSRPIGRRYADFSDTLHICSIDDTGAYRHRHGGRAEMARRHYEA